jgi:hypothetical protein
MYMPLQNYRDLEIDYLENYWSQGKDILGVTHFGDLVPEVLWLGPAYEAKVDRLADIRIKYKLAKCQRGRQPEDIKQEILAIKSELRTEIEAEMIRRLQALRQYMRSPARDPHISLEEIFRTDRKSRRLGSVANLVRNSLRRLRQGKECRVD